MPKKKVNQSATSETATKESGSSMQEVPTKLVSDREKKPTPSAITKTVENVTVPKASPKKKIKKSPGVTKKTKEVTKQKKAPKTNGTQKKKTQGSKEKNKKKTTTSGEKKEKGKKSKAGGEQGKGKKKEGSGKAKATQG
jgi:hypothetical protein